MFQVPTRTVVGLLFPCNLTSRLVFNVLQRPGVRNPSAELLTATFRGLASAGQLPPDPVQVRTGKTQALRTSTTVSRCLARDLAT